MPVEIACCSYRSDTKHFAKCGLYSLRYCRKHCWRREYKVCDFLNKNKKAEVKK